MRIFFFLIVFVPVLEAVVIVKLVQSFGWPQALMMVFVTGVIGIGLARFQGFVIIGQIRADMAAGRMPAPRLIDGVLILLAGALLLTPGLITDVLGFILLVPSVRRLVRQSMRARIEKWIREGNPHIVVRRF